MSIFNLLFHTQFIIRQHYVDLTLTLSVWPWLFPPILTSTIHLYLQYITALAILFTHIFSIPLQSFKTKMHFAASNTCVYITKNCTLRPFKVISIFWFFQSNDSMLKMALTCSFISAITLMIHAWSVAIFIFIRWGQIPTWRQAHPLGLVTYCLFH